MLKNAHFLDILFTQYHICFFNQTQIRHNTFYFPLPLLLLFASCSKKDNVSIFTNQRASVASPDQRDTVLSLHGIDSIALDGGIASVQTDHSYFSNFTVQMSSPATAKYYYMYNIAGNDTGYFVQVFSDTLSKVKISTILKGDTIQIFESKVAILSIEGSAQRQTKKEFLINFTFDLFIYGLSNWRYDDSFPTLGDHERIAVCYTRVTQIGACVINKMTGDCGTCGYSFGGVYTRNCHSVGVSDSGEPVIRCEWTYSCGC